MCDDCDYDPSLLDMAEAECEELKVRIAKAIAILDLDYLECDPGALSEIMLRAKCALEGEE